MNPTFDPRVDPYKVLGVDPKASADEIKKAYRKLAKLNHPDTTGGDKAKETRFKEVSSAYDVLSDPKTRAQYDEVRAAVDSGRFSPGPGGGGAGPAGFSGFSSGGPGGADFGGFDLGDLFAQMFGGAAGGPGGPGRGNPRVHVSRNGDGDFQVHEFVDGAGFDPAGRGGARRGPAPGAQQQGARRRRRGPSVPPDPTPPPQEQQVRTPDGSIFTLRGLDTHGNLRLGVDEAILGAVREVPVPTPGGKASVKVPPGTSSGVKLRLKGRGVSDGERTGDHYVTIHIDVPQADTDEAKRLLVDFMRASKPQPKRSP